MAETQLLDSDLAQYSIAAQAVLELKKPAKRLGELALYTAAAGSALALAPVAEAAIMYSGPQNITVHRVSNGSSFKSVDLNFNGQGDMSFSILSYTGGGFQSDIAVAYGSPGSVTGAYGSARFFDNNAGSLLRLAASSRNIGANYGTNTYLYALGGLRGHSATPGGSSTVFGLWNPGPGASSTGFAGVLIGSATTAAKQFGWLHFKLTTDSQNRTASLTLIDWAFQSVSGAGIHVGDKGTSSIPEPSTLGLLALGASGIALLRRRRNLEKKAEAVQ